MLAPADTGSLVYIDDYTMPQQRNQQKYLQKQLQTLNLFLFNGLIKKRGNHLTSIVHIHRISIYHTTSPVVLQLLSKTTRNQLNLL